MYDYFRVAYYLGNLLRHTHWSREKLLEYQNLKVREIVKYAYEHVPFYHEKFRQLGLRPEDVKTVEDLKKIPVIERRELQRNADKIISDEFDVTKLKRISTSGSTGQPLFTYITRKEDAFRKAKLLRANIVCGQKPRDKWVVITGPQHQAEKYRLQRFLSIYMPIPISVFDDAATQISEIERIGPDILDGYSSSLLLIAKEAEKKGTETIRPKMIIGGAELIDSSSRKFIEAVFNAPFYDEFACMELERLAWQCEERRHYHIDADSVIMQFLDERGEEVGPGESGEIVCTSLFNYAMPFIRYAVGDVGRASKESECPCGIHFPLMEVIEGRKDSFIVLPDGRVLSPLVFGWIMEFFKYYPCIEQYRVVQKRIDLFRFIIRKKNSEVDEKVMGAELVEHFRQFLKLGESKVDFEVDFVDEIPLDKSGKLRKIVSELKGYSSPAFSS
jgi:phenylacetate-CoA ligase